MKYFSEGCTTAPNPNPTNFTILTIREFVGKQSICAAEVNYPGCTVYKGNKILVFKSSEAELKKRISLDPHFLEDNTSAIARFPFTYEGWQDAIKYAWMKSRGSRKTDIAV